MPMVSKPGAPRPKYPKPRVRRCLGPLTRESYERIKDTLTENDRKAIEETFQMMEEKGKK